MSVFRNAAEPDPGPGAEAQLAQSAQLARPPEVPTAIPSGLDAGLAASLADLKQSYVNAAKIQSEEARQNAIRHAMTTAKIAENTPRTSVNFVDHDPQAYQTGNADL